VSSSHPSGKRRTRDLPTNGSVKGAKTAGLRIRLAFYIKKKKSAARRGLILRGGKPKAGKSKDRELAFDLGIGLMKLTSERQEGLWRSLKSYEDTLG